MEDNFKLTKISDFIWSTRYQYFLDDTAIDKSISDTWRRVANAVAANEGDSKAWSKKFCALLEDFKFLPGGRILAGAGTKHNVTLLNCFVMGSLDDSMEGIFEGLREGALTMQAGGGIGYDFSPLRPRGSHAKSAGTISSGPVSFMKIWNAMCSTVLSTGRRRGAMMATLRCDHPDILEFISEKAKSSELKHFNLSVLVTDELINCVREDKNFELKFNNKVHKTIPAIELWDAIMQNTFAHSEPGVLFIDRINRENNLNYCENIQATNPCGEIPLPPYGACNLGSFNLSQFVTDSFSDAAKFDMESFSEQIPIAVRFLDNVIDISHYPLESQKTKEQSSRRLGLGITGLADCLAKLGVPFESQKGIAFTKQIFELLRDQAYTASVELAKDRGSFTEFESAKFLKSDFCKRLPESIRSQILKHGLRNSHLIAVAPAGTISLLANNVSSGIEPIFSLEQRRRILNADGVFEEYEIKNAAWSQFLETKSSSFNKDDIFKTAASISPTTHLKYLEVAQPYVDNSISKTINLNRDISYENFKDVYMQAFEMGLKGCTTFKPNPHTGSILSDHS
jgi:ribonucleoside-diphosphate reductase alpha chain